MLYHVAVVQRPCVREAEAGKGSEVMLGPVTVEAPHEHVAILRAIVEDKDCPTGSFCYDRLEIHVRPF